MVEYIYVMDELIAHNFYYRAPERKIILNNAADFWYCFQVRVYWNGSFIRLLGSKSDMIEAISALDRLTIAR